MHVPVQVRLSVRHPDRLHAGIHSFQLVRASSAMRHGCGDYDLRVTTLADADCWHRQSPATAVDKLFSGASTASPGAGNVLRFGQIQPEALPAVSGTDAVRR